MTLRPFIVAILCSFCLLCACSASRKAQSLRRDAVAARLQLSDEQEELLPSLQTLKARHDTIRVTGLHGEELFLMHAEEDESGEMVVQDVLDAAVVVARFRNVAERHGKVDLEFQVVVPAAMQDSRWQLRFYPDMFIQQDSVRLEPVIITGRDYRRAQLRGYQHYEKFLSGIVSDTTRFINLWQLELFLERNIPELYAFKSDSSLVSDEQFASVYGITQRQAVEHYTNQIARGVNDHKKRIRQKMYNRYVKVPIVTEGIRLDTVMVSSQGDFIYNYTQTIATRPSLRKVDIILTGEVWESDRMVYLMSRSAPLSFYISSLSAFVDGSDHFRTRIVERRAEANTTCRVDFPVGRSEVREGFSQNSAEIARIKRTLMQLADDSVFDLDSIVVEASSSPEGSLSSNASLSKRRAAAMASYMDAFLVHYQDSLEREGGFAVDENGQVETLSVPRRHIRFRSRSIPENWSMLDYLVEEDPSMLSEWKELYGRMRKIRNADEREAAMRRAPFYSYMRRVLYPKVRTVRFDFYLHRKGMVKDTVHTTELDSTYMQGVQAIRDRDFGEALSLLGPYRDYNTALAYCALDYNANALDILEGLEKTAQVNYLLAVIYARQGRAQEAVQSYLLSCEQNPSYMHRGNLDPEISSLIRLYELDKLQRQGEDEQDDNFYYSGN